MLVRMIGDVSGTRNGQPWPGIGRDIDLPPDEAIPLIQARMVVAVADLGRGVETAVMPPAEERAEPATDPSVVPSNVTRAQHRRALVKGAAKNVNPDIA